MQQHVRFNAQPLKLKAGDKVRIKDLKSIMETLDENGKLDNMPFMPEMVQFCGKEYEVGKRADKTCDTIYKTGGRRVRDSVHLDNLRCDGSKHGDCGAACLIFWKEAWLELPGKSNTESINESDKDIEFLSEKSIGTASSDPDEIAYRCQTTELVNFTEKLNWWDLRQYYRDLASRNVTLKDMIRVSIISFFRILAHKGIGYRMIVRAYNASHKLLGTIPWPYRDGQCEKTPKEILDLKVGELVEIKSHDEIMQTLDKRNKNRGLYFDPTMAEYCGKQYRVLSRVNQILDEETGKMLKLPNDCVILEDVVCISEHAPLRLFCPRAIYPYWREIWLKRING